MGLQKPKKLSSDVVYKTDYFEVVSDDLLWPDNVQRNYSYARARDGVCVAALNQNQEVYLLKEYKYPSDSSMITVPAGGIDAGETILNAAQRELQEEAGVVADTWHNLGLFYPMAATATFRGYCFLALDVTETRVDRDETEQIEIFKVPIDEAVKMVTDGKVEDGWAMITLLLAEKHLQSL